MNRGSDADGPTATGAPSPALGESPISLPTASTAPLPAEVPTTIAATPATGGGGGATTTVAGAGTGASTTTTAPPGASSPTTAAVSRVISSQRDGADVTGPGYADLRAVSVERIGERLRISVEVGADVPATLQAREVIGLGVDFSKPGAFESDVQVFVDGGEGGWRAYLHAEDGFVDYPGTFGIGGNRLVFELPASAMPDPLPPVVSAFLDWSTKSPTPATSSDALPDQGPLRPTP